MIRVFSRLIFSQPPFDLLVNEPLQGRPHIASPDDKVVRIAHQNGFGPLGWAVLGMKHMVEPVQVDIRH